MYRHAQEPLAVARYMDGQPPEVEPFFVDVRVRFADVDGMGHANNAKYLTYLEEARTAWATDEVGLKSLDAIDFILAHVSIDYLAAARLGQVVRVSMWVPRIGARSWDFAYALTDAVDGRVFARARSTQVAYDYAAGRAKPVPDHYLASLRRLAGPLD